LSVVAIELIAMQTRVSGTNQLYIIYARNYTRQSVLIRINWLIENKKSTT